MKHILACLSIVLAIMGISGCGGTEGNIVQQKISKASSVSINQDEKKGINLEFSQVPIVKIEQGEPEKDWMEAKSIEYWEVGRQRPFVLHLYIGSTDGVLSSGGDVYALLEYKEALYNIGKVSSYGVEDVEIKIIDITYDGQKQIYIAGGIGAAYKELKLIGYDEEEGWVNLLTMGTPLIVDLDNDGKLEYIATSAGSLPPYVDIYRWNNRNFEKAEVAKQTGDEYALLYNKMIDNIDTWVIETGTSQGEKHFYRYHDGRLIEITNF
jgi:hypothetical protein